MCINGQKTCLEKRVDGVMFIDQSNGTCVMYMPFAICLSTLLEYDSRTPVFSLGGKPQYTTFESPIGSGARSGRGN